MDKLLDICITVLDLFANSDIDQIFSTNQLNYFFFLTYPVKVLFTFSKR